LPGEAVLDAVIAFVIAVLMICGRYVFLYWVLSPV
jgi:hypothetical protein